MFLDEQWASEGSTATGKINDMILKQIFYLL